MENISCSFSLPESPKRIFCTKELNPAMPDKNTNAAPLTGIFNMQYIQHKTQDLSFDGQIDNLCYFLSQQRIC